MERLIGRSTDVSTAAVATAKERVDEPRVAFETLYRESRDDVYAGVFSRRRREATLDRS